MDGFKIDAIFPVIVHEVFADVDVPRGGAGVVCGLESIAAIAVEGIAQHPYPLST